MAISASWRYQHHPLGVGSYNFVIPVKTGIYFAHDMDTHLRGDDNAKCIPPEKPTIANQINPFPEFKPDIITKQVNIAP
ncbi:MAG: hypothetical protein GF398_12615 [Chitinivibrionales bacterium]|nr:hypothetical protein [Chitinivibrionales bacterium]